MTDQLLTPDRAMGIGAHPDDIEFGAGGTLARWAADGAEVTMLVVTDGSKGTWDRSLEPARLAAIRRDEQLAAAHVMGAAHVVHLDHVDGELEYSKALRAQIALQVRLQRPDVVLSHDPWLRYELHPDHRATGLAAVDGVVAARDHLFFPEQGVSPHRPQALLLWSAQDPDHWEDIASSVDIKIEALLMHASQGKTTMGGATDDAAFRDDFAVRVRGWAADAGKAVNLDAAEAFKRITP